MGNAPRLPFFSNSILHSSNVTLLIIIVVCEESPFPRLSEGYSSRTAPCYYYNYKRESITKDKKNVVIIIGMNFPTRLHRIYIYETADYMYSAL